MDLSCLHNLDERTVSAVWFSLWKMYGFGENDTGEFDPFTIFRILLRTKLSIDSVNSDGKSALHIACKRLWLDGVKFLLTHGTTSLNSQDMHGCTPLMLAIDGESPYVVEEDGELDGNVTDYEILLHEMSENQEVKRLLPALRNTASSSGKDRQIKMAEERLEIIKVLIASGSEVNVNNGAMTSPLQVAVQIGDPELIKILLSANADVNWREPKSNRTVLHTAVIKGDVTILEQLLRTRSNAICARDKPHRWSPLHLAVCLGRLDCTKRLMSYGADPNAYAIDWGSPLFLAVRDNNVEILRTLLQCGARTNIWGVAGRTALIQAILEEEEDSVLALLQSGADPDGIDRRGIRCPIHELLQKEDILDDSCITIFRYLVKYGCNVDKCCLYQQGQNMIYGQVGLQVLSAGNLSFSPMSYKLSPIQIALLNLKYHKTPLAMHFLLSAACSLVGVYPIIVAMIDSKEHIEIPGEFIFHLQTPHSLLNICRKVILRSVSHKRANKCHIEALPLPKPLINYLDFQDL